MKVFNVVVLGTEKDGLEPFVAAMNACQDGVGPLIIMSGYSVEEVLSHLEVKSSCSRI
jgi:acetylglutamate kinase